MSIHYNYKQMKKFTENLLKFLEIDLVFPERLISKIIIALFFSFFIFLFLIYYKPFNLDQFNEEILNLSCVYAAITGGIIFFILIVTHPFIKARRLHFTNGLLLVLFLIAMPLNYLANLIFTFSLPYGPNLDINHNYIILMMDILYGPALIITNIIDWKTKKLVIIDLKLQEKVDVEKTEKDFRSLKIVNNENKVLLEVRRESIVAAYSNENYSEVFVLKNGDINKLLIRITFTKLFNQLSKYPEFIRCHRTRIVNMKYVNGFIHNAGTRFLRMKYIDEAIPVSRNYPIEQHLPSLSPHP